MRFDQKIAINDKIAINLQKFFQLFLYLEFLVLLLIDLVDIVLLIIIQISATY